MRIVIKLLLVIVMFVAGIGIGIAMKPSHFQVSRSAHIKAAPAAVFPHVNNLREWDAWSPWAKLDPAAKFSHEGPEEGSGAICRWEGNQEVGVGSMTIVESEPAERVAINLEFVKPMAGVSLVEFTFVPENDGTVVTWTMSGHNSFMAKVMGLFFDCEKMVGGMFEKGLAQMKAVVEASPVKAPQAAPATQATEATQATQATQAAASEAP